MSETKLCPRCGCMPAFAASDGGYCSVCEVYAERDRLRTLNAKLQRACFNLWPHVSQLTAVMPKLEAELKAAIAAAEAERVGVR